MNMMRKRKHIVLLIIFQIGTLLFMNSYIFAQDQVVLDRLSGSIILDGLIDEQAWQDIEPLPLEMRYPNFRDIPTERTELLLGYDDVYLYIAGRLYDREPSRIQSTATKRDDWKTNLDQIGIVLDTFNDNENGMVFIATPSGLRIDAIVQNDGKGVPEMNVNLSWNTFWDVETVCNDKGWFVEIRIPFSSLRFQDQEGRVVMGLMMKVISI